MNGSEELLRKRAEELSRRAYGGCWTNTEFLSAAEQSLIEGMRRTLPSAFTFEGGHPAAERRIAMFGSEDLCGYVCPPPIICVCIQPKNAKFADKLEHRDFLGALLNLGIRREVLGDIFVREEGAYLFCLDSIAQYIIDSLEKVKHTSVTCRIIEDAPATLEVETERKEFNVPSERIDAVICAIYKLSRTQCQQLFDTQRVFVNSRITEHSSRPLKEGDVISVRRYGRFTYLGPQRETKKGRLYVAVEIPK